MFRKLQNSARPDPVYADPHPGPTARLETEMLREIACHGLIWMICFPSHAVNRPHRQANLTARSAAARISAESRPSGGRTSPEALPILAA